MYYKPLQCRSLSPYLPRKSTWIQSSFIGYFLFLKNYNRLDTYKERRRARLEANRGIRSRQRGTARNKTRSHYSLLSWYNITKKKCIKYSGIYAMYIKTKSLINIIINSDKIKMMLMMNKVQKKYGFQFMGR